MINNLSFSKPKGSVSSGRSAMPFTKPKDEGSLLGAAAPKALSSGLLGLKFMQKPPGSAPPPAGAALESATERSSSSSSSSAAAAAEVQPPPQSLSLSKSVMGMKFMKRSTETDLNDKEDRAKRLRLVETMPRQPPDRGEGEGALYRFEECDDVAAMPGRLSFGGFNRSVERHYEQAMAAHRYERKVANGDVITDEEFVARYTNLIGLPGRLALPDRTNNSNSNSNTKKKKKRRQGEGDN